MGALLLSACSHTEVRQHAPFDTTHKTIALPPHNAGLMRTIAKELSAAGWKVSIDDRLAKPPAGKTKGANRDPAKAEPATPSSATARPKTRYSMTADYRDIDLCRGGRISIYDFTVIDNESGAKVLEQGGRECGRELVAKFKATIAAKVK